MKACLTLALLWSACWPVAEGQAVPAATGAGSAELRYAVRYSESKSTSQYTYGNWHLINPSGSLDFTNGKTKRLFSLEYAGGYSSTISGQPYAEGMFQRMRLSQGLDLKRWTANFSDSVSYTPQAPTTGFSGIPGTGEPIGGPASPSGQLVLTLNTHTLSNDAFGEIRDVMNFGTSLILNGSYSVLRYPDANGINTDQLTIGPGLDFRIDARNSLTGRYSFSRFHYSSYDTVFQSNTMLFGYRRSWSRAFRSEISVGPQWTKQATNIPNSMGIAAQGSLNYEASRYSANVFYNHGTSGGSGYLLGAESDSVDAGFSRRFVRAFTFEMTGAYNRSNNLAGTGTIVGEYGSAQASWQIGRHLNAFASYTAMSQSANTMVPSNVLNQLLQTVSFGISFSKELNRAK